MSVWKGLTPGDTVIVRLKRAMGDTEDVVVAKTLPKTLRDGVRFESVDGRIFTFYEHDLTMLTPARPAGRNPRHDHR